MRPRQFINPHRWYDDYLRSARARGNETGQRLGELYYQTGRSSQRDQLKGICDEGVKIAKMLDEPYWELYFRLIAYDVSPDNGFITDELIQMSIDISQPRYEGCPMSGRVYQALLNAYSTVDPLGHAQDILDGTDYVEHNIPLDEETYISLGMYRLRVYMAQRNWSQAYHEGTEYHNQALEAVDWYHTIRSSIRLAEVLYEMGNYYTALDTLSKCNLALAKRRDPSWDKTVLLWYLPLYKKVGDEENYDKVRDKIKEMAQVPSYDYLSGRAKLEAIFLDDNTIDSMDNLLKLRDFFDEDKYRHLRISLNLEYLVQLGKTSIWWRILHYGTNTTFGSILAIPVDKVENTRVLFLIVLAIFLSLSMIVGIFVQLSGHVKRQTIHEIRTAISKSSAKGIYEDRLLRIEAGDYSQLS